MFYNTNMTVAGTHMHLPAYVLQSLGALEAQGYESWCVGGCVRDALLNRPTHDFDIATSASWQDTERVLSDAGFSIHRTGTKHGTVTATMDGNPLEITTFRSDGAYSDGRHPDEVRFVSTIEEDLKRRDFTINALAYHPERGILDSTGGLEDLEGRVIRVVGDPSRRFKEDGLRILRGCRFASQLGFQLEPETLQAMTCFKMRLTQVSAERIAHELDGLLLGEYVYDALMQTIDILGAVMPEIMACKGFDQHSPYHIYDVWEHTAWVVQNAPATRLVRWTALLHDIGKPAACFFEGERAHFYGHAKLSALMARDVLARLRLSPQFVDRVVQLVRIHDDQFPATHKGVRKALARLDGDVDMMRALIALKRADAQAHSELGKQRVEVADELERQLDDVLASQAAFSVKQLDINGNDILALGIPAGPRIGKLLDEALEAVIDEHVPNEREAILCFLQQQCRL